MRPSDYRRAVVRLEDVSLPSPVTREALRMARMEPSEATLIGHLAYRHLAAPTLMLLSALEDESENVFEAVAESIRRDSYNSWALVESLNELPWYNGLRAFLSLPDDPCSSEVVYPFYILARNKTFVTAEAARERYDYYVRGLWSALGAARDERWSDPDGSVVSVVELMHRLLDVQQPDLFVVYFASLLLGRVAPRPSSIQALKARLENGCCPAVKAAAAVTLRHID